MEGIIKLLNDEGYSILLIDDQYYITFEFIPGDRNLQFHTLNGKNITEVLKNNLNIGYQAGVVKGQIDKLEIMNIKLSISFAWKWYTSS